MTDNQPPQPSQPPTYVWVVVLMGVLLLAVQALVLFVLLDTRSDVASLREDTSELGLQLALAGVTDAPVTPSTTASTDAGEGAAPGTTATPATTSTAEAATPPETRPATPAPEFTNDVAGLPVFDGNLVADPAIGTQLGTLGAVEWNAGQEVTFDLADGKARALVVFAHWCPVCQEELPQLAAWHEANAAELTDMELVTIASATDQDDEGTVQQYLSDNDFPFPVLLDSDNELAARLGVNAFPFWVFVDPGGRVIGRIDGFLPADQFETLFADLDEVGAGS